MPPEIMGDKKMKMPPFFITTAISYPNGAPHLGHAYEAVIADMLARFKRLEGYDVFFLTGVDEHGQKMLQTATQKDITPKQLCQVNVPLFQKMLTNLSVTHDHFIRTSEPQHRQAVEHFWRLLVKKKRIQKGIYQGWYAHQDECFYQKSDLQWEGDTPIAPTGAQVKFIKEECYFFDLSLWEKKLLSLYEKNPQWIFPSARMNEVRRFVEGGLRRLAVSRKGLSWGIAVPEDAEQTIYVWLDALVNYVSALGYPDEKNTLFVKHWPCHIHVIGKDIVRFHGTYWPAFLLAAEMPLPKKLAVHGHIMIEGKKMSKSIGNILEPQELIDQYGSDQVRYFLLREVPMGEDGHYSPAQMHERLNADLAHTLGNLVHRVFTLVHKHCDGRIPSGSVAQDATQEQKRLLDTLYLLPKRATKHIETLVLHRYLEEMFLLLRQCNQVFTKEAPWEQAKDHPEKMRQTLYVTLEILRGVAILLQVALPLGMEKLLTMLGQSPSQRGFQTISPKHALEEGLPIASLQEPLYNALR